MMPSNMTEDEIIKLYATLTTLHKAISLNCTKIACSEIKLRKVFIEFHQVLGDKIEKEIMEIKKEMRKKHLILFGEVISKSGCLIKYNNLVGIEIELFVKGECMKIEAENRLRAYFGLGG